MEGDKKVVGYGSSWLWEGRGLKMLAFFFLLYGDSGELKREGRLPMGFGFGFSFFFFRDEKDVVIWKEWWWLLVTV